MGLAVIISLALLVAPLVSASSVYNYMYVISINNFNIGYAVALTSSRVVALGVHYGALSWACGTNEEILVFLLDYSGNIVATRTMCASTYGKEYVYDAIVYNDNVYFVGTMRWIPGQQYNQTYDALIGRIDFNGLVWLKAYGSYTTDESFNAVTVLDEIYVTGSVDSRLLVAKINKNTGDVIWAYTYSGQYDSISGLSITVFNNNIFVLARASIYGNLRNLVIRLDTNGNVLTALETQYVFFDMASGDAIYLVGTAVAKLDSALNVIWARGLDAYIYSSTYRDGHLYLAGSRDGKPVVLKVGSDGSILMAKQLTMNGTLYSIDAYNGVIYATGVSSTAMIIIGVHESFVNEYVTNTQVSITSRSIQFTNIPLSRSSWVYQQTASGSSTQVNYSPSPLFRTATQITTTPPAPAPPPSVTPNPYTPTISTPDMTPIYELFVIVLAVMLFLRVVLSILKL